MELRRSGRPFPLGLRHVPAGARYALVAGRYRAYCDPDGPAICSCTVRGDRGRSEQPSAAPGTAGASGSAVRPARARRLCAVRTADRLSPEL